MTSKKAAKVINNHDIDNDPSLELSLGGRILIFSGYSVFGLVAIGMIFTA